MTSRLSVGLRQAGAGAVFMALALLIGAAIPLVPLIRDDWALDQVVRAVALDLRDFGVEKANERLRFELAAEGLADHVREEDCTIDAQARSVQCAWGVVLDVPIVQRQIPLNFDSSARTTVVGDLL